MFQKANWADDFKVYIHDKMQRKFHGKHTKQKIKRIMGHSKMTSKLVCPNLYQQKY